MLLLTGAAGFIARHFTAMRRYDFARYSDLVCVDKAPEVPDTFDRFDYMRADLTSVKQVCELFDKIRPKTVVHLAGVSKVGENGDANKAILRNLFEAARSIGFERPHFVIAGSAAEYGDIDLDAELPKEGAPLAPIDSYAISKTDCYRMAQQWADIHNLPVAWLRFANVYGPGQKDRFFPLVIDAVQQGKPIVLNGAGRPLRQFVYVTDICRALWFVVSQGVSGVYNLGGVELSMADAARVAITAVHDFQLRNGIIPQPVIFDLRQDPAGAMRVGVDSTKAYSELGWTPLVSIYDGLRRTVVDRLQGELRRESRAVEAS